MGHDFINVVLQPLAVFGGIAMVIWASARAKLEHKKMEIQRWQQTVAPPPVAARQDDAVLAELKSLKTQIGQMQETGHQFDISFDAALTRLEERVARVETKTATQPTTEEVVQGIGVR